MEHPSVPDRFAPGSDAGNCDPHSHIAGHGHAGRTQSGEDLPHQPFENLAGMVPGAEQLFESGCVRETWSAVTVEDWFPNQARSSDFWRGPSAVRKDLEARKHTASWSPGERRPTVPRRKVRGTGPAASTIVTAGRPEPQGWSQRDSPAPHRPGVMGALVFVQSTAHISRIVLDRAARYTPMAARDDNRCLSSFEEAAEPRLRATPRSTVNSFIAATGYPAGGFFGRSHC